MFYSRIQKRKKRIWKNILFSFLLLITIITVFYLGKVSSEVVTRQIQADEIVRAYQITRSIDAGEKILGKDLKEVLLPKEQVGSFYMAEQDYKNKYAKLNLTKGTILNSCMIYEGEGYRDDLRIHRFSYIKLTDKMNIGDYIDIRICFENGADFVVLSKKKIEDIAIQSQEENLLDIVWFKVTEEELLRLSSAVVDALLHETCEIYAVQYITETQKAAVITYPVNDTVKQLIKTDPNIIQYAENVMETNLREEFEFIKAEKKQKETIINTEEINLENETDQIIDYEDWIYH